MLRFGGRFVTVSCAAGVPEDAAEAVDGGCCAAGASWGNVAALAAAVLLAVVVAEALAGAAAGGVAFVTMLCESADGVLDTTSASLGWRGGIGSYGVKVGATRTLWQSIRARCSRLCARTSILRRVDEATRTSSASWRGFGGE